MKIKKRRLAGVAWALAFWAIVSSMVATCAQIDWSSIPATFWNVVATAWIIFAGISLAGVCAVKAISRLDSYLDPL